MTKEKRRKIDDTNGNLKCEVPIFKIYFQTPRWESQHQYYNFPDNIDKLRCWYYVIKAFKF